MRGLLAPWGGTEARDVRLLARHWWVLVVRGLLAIALGILALSRPDATFQAFVLVFGAYAIVFGALFVVLGLRLRGMRARLTPAAVRM